MQTPYYVIHKEKIDELIAELKFALDASWNNYMIGYSFKTNALFWILDYMRQNGLCAEVVSNDEYQLAKAVNYGNKIIYNGPIKSKNSFLEAVNEGCIVNIDSKREIEWLKANKSGGKYKVGLRVNFDLEKYCPGESQCAKEGGRFGFCYENGELKKAIDELRENDILISGLHLHCSSRTRSVGIYKAIARICCEIAEKYQLELEYVDLGGGYFGGLDHKPGFSDYFQIVSDILKGTFDVKKTKLIVEPGMSLIGAPIDYVTTVVDVKVTTYNRFVITDGSRTNIDPLMKKSTYFYHIVSCEKNMEEGHELREVVEKQVVCGFTCMENDRIISLTDAKRIAEGDRIVYEKVGAYTMCLAPLFIEWFPDVYLEEDGKYIRVRERWTADKLLG